MGKQAGWRVYRLPACQLLVLVVSLALALAVLPARSQFRSSYATQTQAGRTGQSGQRPLGQPIKYGGGIVYPEFRSSYGAIRWIKEQMPLKVYVSRGLTLEQFLDEEMGVPVVNVNNLAKWPDLLAEVVQNPEAMNELQVAQGFTPEHFQAALQGISMWKPFEKEGLFSFVLTEDPSQADIHVFWVHHFVDKMGLALFSGDIRGYTAKRSFPYKAIMAGGRADFRPVLIMLRTTEANGVPMPFAKMRAAAAHEFGHALGIEGHSTNPNDLMSLYYGQGVISANDAATIRYLYHLTPDLIP
ncbi:MAG TPA: matrixin family metalloprotease [Candidatus Obscuribacterales bacterium]